MRLFVMILGEFKGRVKNNRGERSFNQLKNKEINFFL